MEDIYEKLVRASRLHELHRYHQSIELLIEVIAKDPYNREAHFVMINNFNELKKYAKADEYANRLLTFASDSFRTMYAKAHCELQLGRLNSAKQFIKRAIKLHPQSSNSFNLLGVIYQSQSQFVKAINCYEKGLAIDPSNANCLNNKIVCEAALMQLEGLDTDIKYTLLNNTEEAHTYYATGFAYLQKGNHIEARKFLREALRIEPENNYYKSLFLETVRYEYLYYRLIAQLVAALKGTNKIVYYIIIGILCLAGIGIPLMVLYAYFSLVARPIIDILMRFDKNRFLQSHFQRNQSNILVFLFCCLFASIIFYFTRLDSIDAGMLVLYFLLVIPFIGHIPEKTKPIATWLSSILAITGLLGSVLTQFGDNSSGYIIGDSLRTIYWVLFCGFMFLKIVIA